MESKLNSKQQKGFLIIGGVNSLWNCAKYHIATKRRTFLPLNTARCYATAAKVGDYVYVAGGCASVDEADINIQRQHCDPPVKTCEMLDLKESNTWVDMADMLEARILAASAVIGKRIYVSGGRSNDNDLRSCEVYDVQRDIWKKIHEMLQPRSHHAMCSLDYSLYCLGGSFESEKSCEHYDIRSGEWSLISPMNEITYGLASVEFDGKIYAIGGWGKPAVECYDPVAGKWRLLAQKQVDSSYHGACVVNQQIYAVGGWNGCKSLNSVEVYNKLQDSWSPCFSLVEPVYGHTVVAI